MEKLKCLGLACSPRQGGNTTLLLERALRGAASAGAEVELIRLADYNISPCQACDLCSRDGKCILKDDAAIIFEKILKADRVIMAAPIFAMGLNAQAKTLVDRSQRFWATKYVLKKPVIENPQMRPARRGIFISAAGTNLKGVFDGAQRVVQYFYKMLEIKLEGSHCYPQTDKRGAILENAQALEEVFQAGKRLVE